MLRVKGGKETEERRSTHKSLLFPLRNDIERAPDIIAQPPQREFNDDDRIVAGRSGSFVILLVTKSYISDTCTDRCRSGGIFQLWIDFPPDKSRNKRAETEQR